MSSYRGVLRIYVDGADDQNSGLVKAVRLSSRSTVRDLRPLLADKFNLIDRLSAYDPSLVRITENGGEILRY